ncbi:MAG: hypothetical protein JOZ71_01935 [Ktedonobacteraceae bacterium]|nr:hypothetical protein [Ktedonobacteraceae bacterium]
MEYAYRAEAWQAMYTTLASATATLTGLLFVALSLDLSTIIKIPAYRARARETLVGLLCLLALSIFLLIPGQDRRFLGGELIAESLIIAVMSIRLQLQTLKNMDAGRRMHWAMRLVVLNLGTVTILIAGISLTIGQFGGLLWLVPTILIDLLWSLNNVWLLVVRVAEEQS